MKSFIHLLPAVAFILAACVNDTAFPTNTSVVLEGRSAGYVCETAGAPVHTWTPNEDDVRTMEAALYPLLATELLRDPEHYGAAEASDYYRHYAGMVIEGRRVICVQGTHRSVYEREYATTRDWRGPILIRDGGSIQFHVRYDPVASSFEGFAFNFVA